MKALRRRPLHYVIRNLAGIELTPEAIAECFICHVDAVLQWKRKKSGAFH